jgi:hypothetical protein
LAFLDRCNGSGGGGTQLATLRRAEDLTDSRQHRCLFLARRDALNAGVRQHALEQRQQALAVRPSGE